LINFSLFYRFLTGASFRKMIDLKILPFSVIIFLTLEGVPPVQILNRLLEVYHGEVRSLTQVLFWENETKRSRKSVQDEKWSGRPENATSIGNIEAVERLVEGNR
jgi:hypothetical protein